MDSNIKNIYKELFDISPNGMYYFDEKGVILDCNKVFLKSINSKKELMIGFDTLNRLKNKDIIKATKDCLTTGEGYYEGPYTSVTGNKHIVSKGTFKGLRNENGDIIGGLCILEDITVEHERKQKLIDLNNEYATLNEAYLEQNEELQQVNAELNEKNKSLEEEQKKNIELITQLTVTEKNYRTIFYNSPLPMIVHAKGQIVLANDAAMSFANIKNREDVIGNSVLSFVHESSIETAKKNIAKVMQGEQTRVEEEKFVTIDGRIKDVIVNSSQFIYNNEIALLVAFADISDVKKINNELLEKNKLLEIESEKNNEILKKLSIAEKNYKTIFDNSPNPIVAHQDGRFLFLNDAALKFVGAKNAKDIIGKPILPFAHKDSIDLVKKNTERILEGKTGKLLEEKYITLDGRTKDVLVKSGLCFFNNKPAVLASFVDVTEFKDYKEKIRLISKGIDSSPASIVITDITGNIEIVNPKFTEVTGYTEEEVIGLNPRILKSGKHKIEFYQNMWSLLSLGKNWRGEVCNKKKNGELFWEYAIISPIENDNGEITHYIAIKEDITKRKEIETKLLANEKHFKTLYETAPDGILEINEKGVIINCNAEFSKSIKLKKPEIIGKYAIDFVGNPILFKKLFYKLKTKGYIETEITQLNGDGTITMVWRKAIGLFDKNKKFVGAIAYSRDISQIKTFEKELVEAKNKAEEADKLKSAFLSNMSHEVRTPLNAIIGFTDLINRENISPIDKNKYSNYIKHNSKLLLNLINDIIDVSKIEANQIKIHKTKTDLKSLFEELHHTFLTEYKENPNDVKLELEICKEPVNFYTDEYRLRQIISNLVSNSIKFTTKGTISYGYKKVGNEIKLFVKDTGQGISEEFSAKIFKRFFKLGSLTNNKGGTGIGLSIVKNLTELLDGEIDLITEKNIGTEFVLTFSCKESQTKLDEKTKNNFELSDFNWSDKTILVAEDDEFNFIVLEEILKISKINILHAKDGKEAVNLFKEYQNKIDIILMDIQMPKMNGYEATKEILKIDENAQVVAQTAFAMSNERDKSIDVGCIDYITKPIDIDKLTLLLANYLR